MAIRRGWRGPYHHSLFHYHEGQIQGQLSFADHGLGSYGINIDWGNTFISAHKAYLTNSSDVTLIWDPTELKILDRLEHPELSRDAPFSYELVGLVPESRCPGMNNKVSTDEAGNLYFSNWVYNVAETLVRGAPKSCALRVNAGKDEFDPKWQLTFSDVTDGREGAALGYLGEGQAVTPNWRLWRVDLDENTAAPLDGVDALAGGYSMVQVNGRTLLMVPSEDYASTAVHEVSPQGKVTKLFEAPGFSYQVLGLGAMAAND